jgi:23S rRNA C2498 (ribose-2'-O)-methylase RlmM
VEYFGNIIAKGNSPLECVVIHHPEEILDLYERNAMSVMMKEKILNLKIMLETRYKHLRNKLKNY